MRRRLLFALLIFLAVGPVPGAVFRFPVDNFTQSVVARPLDVAPGRTGALRFVRGWHLVSPNSRFGGFSALAQVGPGRFQLVSDAGGWTRLTLHPDGRVTNVRIGLLPTPEGGSGRKSLVDAEAMAIDPASGASWIAFEGINEIRRYDPALSRIESRRTLPRPAWPGNGGPEAMARLADGRTIVFSEDADDDSRGREALLYATDPAAPGPPPLRFFYDAQGKGSVSDAAPLPDGRILLAHRRLGLLPIFTTILAVVDPADIGPDAVVRSSAIGRVPRTLADNFEGAAVSVERGRTYVWLVSDDNFTSWQRSLLLQFELVELPPRAADSKKAAP